MIAFDEFDDEKTYLLIEFVIFTHLPMTWLENKPLIC